MALLIGFLKTAGISIVFDPSSPKFVKTLDFALEHIDDVRNAKFRKFKMAVATILDFAKLLPFLHYLTDLHHI